MYRMSLLRILLLPVLAVAATLSLHGQALAQHEGHEHAMADAAAATCPGCGMDGGLCAHCQPMAAEILGNMAVGMCPTCTDPGMLCEMCQSGVDGALAMMATMNPMEMDGPAHDMVCLAGTLDGDFEALYGQLFKLQAEQGLAGESMMTGSIIPDAAADITGSSAIYAAFSLPDGADPQDPLFVFNVPAGEFMVFHHDGPDPGVTWMAAYTWLAMTGETVAHAPAGEHHLGAPDENGNMVMDIYIPIDDDDEMDDDDDGDGGMEDDDDEDDEGDD